MKAVTSTSHSFHQLMCPGGQDGLLISTKRLNRTLDIDESSLAITVESGMLLKQLVNVSAAAGLALPYTPDWWGVTVGGLLATGSHGTTLWDKGSAVHDYVVRIRIVTPAGPDEGYVKVRTLENGDPELNAVKVSLGVLGVVSQVTLQLQPLFKRSVTFVEENDSDIGDQVSKLGELHEFANLIWYPSQHKVVYRIDDRVPSNITGDGVYSYVGHRNWPTPVTAILRGTEETLEFTGSSLGKCLYGEFISTSMIAAAYGLTNDGTFFWGYPVVGYQNRIQVAGSCLDSPEDGLLTSCLWDPRIKGIYFFHTAISINLSIAKNFIEDVQSLVDLVPEGLCGINGYIGIFATYVTASSAYLGKQGNALELDILYYRSKDPMTPRLHEDILEEIEQMALFKYGGLPHWGKNRNLAFLGAIDKYRDGSEFLKVKQMYDPSGLFSSDWTDQILGLKDGITAMKEGCALEGLCLCSQDIHCAPTKGYFCRPGKVYTDARVCTHHLPS